MKKRILLVAGVVIALMAVTGCSKQKTCRCAIPGSVKVRVITIDKGECEQLLVYDYHTETDVNVTDTLYCTDYQFIIDSIYKDN